MKIPKAITSKQLAHNKLLKYKVNELIRYVIYLTNKLDDMNIQLESCKQELGLK